jgi:hypothetical protein
MLHSEKWVDATDLESKLKNDVDKHINLSNDIRKSFFYAS